MVMDLGELCCGPRSTVHGPQSTVIAECSGTLTHPRAEGAAHLYLLLHQYAPWRGRLIGASSHVSSDASARGRLRVNLLSSSAQSIVRW
jgi:hypothetical protein